ncbi:MAG: hypothetical protein HZB56_05450 [Deltaproteobacteria bacterium]|nr:hypothetical protein [Deltaproteobacteria bacterium]
MASTTYLTPTISRLDARRVRTLGTSLLCSLVLRISAVRQRLVESIVDVGPTDRAVLLLFAEATRMCLRELGRRARLEQARRGLGSEELDPRQVVEVDCASTAEPPARATCLAA